MSAKIVIGVDGEASGNKAIAFAKKMALQMGECELVLVYVIEWSPFSFQTNDENAERHKRRDEEISTAKERVLNPAIESLKSDSLTVSGIVRHGNVADVLNAIANEQKADQIVVARTSDASIKTRIFGSSASNLVMEAKVPVTVV